MPKMQKKINKSYGTGVVEWDLAKGTKGDNIPQDYIKHTQEERKCL